MKRSIFLTIGSIFFCFVNTVSASSIKSNPIGNWYEPVPRFTEISNKQTQNRSTQPEFEDVYTTVRLNIRKTAAIEDGNILLTAKQNTVLKKVNSYNDDTEWCKVLIGETEYFVSKQYITKEKPVECAESIDEQIARMVARKTPEPGSTAPQPAVARGSYIGSYQLTAYCPCARCCGKSNGITASGTQAAQGRTIACNSMAIGTHVVINGHEYIVEDRGGMANNVIDIFFNSHSEALQFGRQYADVYLAN